MNKYNSDTYAKLFDYFRDEHGAFLLQSTLREIVKIVMYDQDEFKKQLLFEILCDFQIHLKDRDLIDNFEYVFEDEAKIFLYDKFMK